jgi:hypothetical protein
MTTGHIFKKMHGIAALRASHSSRQNERLLFCMQLQNSFEKKMLEIDSKLARASAVIQRAFILA